MECLSLGIAIGFFVFVIVPFVFLFFLVFFLVASEDKKNAAKDANQINVDVKLTYDDFSTKARSQNNDDV